MRTLLLTIALILSYGSNMVAQAPDDCHLTLSLFAEPAKAKNYNAALPHYQKVIEECPKFSLATYHRKRG